MAKVNKGCGYEGYESNQYSPKNRGCFDVIFESLVGLVGFLMVLSMPIFAVALLASSRTHARNSEQPSSHTKQSDSIDDVVQSPQSPNYITGTVVKEIYSRIENDSNPPYTLIIRTDDGRKITLSVVDSPGVTTESLEQVINPGAYIRFPSANYELHRFPSANYELHRDDLGWFHLEERKEIEGETLFENDTIEGTKRADRIQILL